MRTVTTATRSLEDPGLTYRGWVQVGLERTIRRRGPSTVRRFGQDLDVWYDRAGVVHAAERGDDARDRTALGAALPAVTVGGVVFVYHRAPGDDRSVAPPPVPAAIVGLLTEPAGFRSTFNVTVRSSLPGLVENAVDRAHFLAVHGKRVANASTYEYEVREDGSFWARVRLTVKMFPGWVMQSATEAEFADPCNSRIRNWYFGRWFDLVVLTGPLGDHEVDVRFVLLSPRWFPGFDRIFHLGMKVSERILILDDSDVLGSRTMIHRPLLSDADGPILAIRRWLNGFMATPAFPVQAQDASPERARALATAP